ncbi:MAG: arylsulfatase, partial [Acidimicrobiia bacterium]|nr:arylsulfatase [Acidimicrobiia bacterium]
VHWPDGIAPQHRGGKRQQFVNVSDIVPTLYELLGLVPPAVHRGFEQMPVTGHSFASVLGNAHAPATNRLQYFEMFGSRALVAQDGGTWWKAVARHVAGESFDDDRWELYNLSVDPSECNDLAPVEPDRLTDLIEKWWAEARRHGVLPLDDRGFELFKVRPDDHSPHPVSRRYVYRPPMTTIPATASPAAGGRAWELTAQVIRRAGDCGVIYALGNENSGLTVFVQHERLVMDYNAFGDHTIVESEVEVPVGSCTLAAGLGRTSRTTGVITLAVDGIECGRAELPFMMGMVTSLGASVGYDHGSVVSQRYDGPFAFTGDLRQVEIVLGRRSDADAEQTARTEMARQ